ncbi:MAG: sigma-70 family RNA polymerase sigma factor [Armatimonadota bacterium]
MATSNTQYDFDPYIEHVITMKMRRLSVTHALTPDDLDDLRQELYLHVLQQMDKFDPTRAQWTTFVDRMVRSGISTFLRNRRVDLRFAAKCSLLPDEDNDHWSTTFVTDIAGGTSGLPFGMHADDPGAWTEMLDVRIDLADLLASLPPLQQQICALIMHGHTLTDIARTLGMPRTSLYFHLDQIHQAFLAGGFDFSLKMTRHFDPVPFM